MITVIDYKMINIGSILNMLKRVGVSDVKIANSPKDLEQASKIIMPGVGSFDAAIQSLRKLDLINTIKEKAIHEKIPFLGICLGMQLMMQESEEGKLEGLGLVPGLCRKLNPSNKLYKVPHMGWNTIETIKPSYIFTRHDLNRFYFVHSYYVECTDAEDKLFNTNYDIQFTSGFQRDNLIGLQFHPEKSHMNGVSIFENFVES